MYAGMPVWLDKTWMKELEDDETTIPPRDPLMDTAHLDKMIESFTPPPKPKRKAADMTYDQFFDDYGSPDTSSVYEGSDEKKKSISKLIEWAKKNHDHLQEKITCDVCGHDYRRRKRARHMKTKKHMKAV